MTDYARSYREKHGLTPSNGEPIVITEMANARRLIGAHGEDLRYSKQLGCWFVWDSRRFVEDLTGRAQQLAQDVVHSTLDVVGAESDDQTKREKFKAWLAAQRASSVRGVLDLAWSEPGVAVTVDELDADPWLLNLENGVLDLRTLGFRDHDPGYNITKIVQAPYLTDAASPAFDEFIQRVLPDEEVRGFVQRGLGRCVTGDVGDQHLFIPHGGGANGKSTLLNSVRRLLDDYAVHLHPDVLMATKHNQHPTALTDLLGARFAMTIEVEQGKRLAESLVKMLTGGENIRARRMHRDFFEFAPTHKLWLACNHLPTIWGADEAIWRRILVIPFTVTIPEDERDPDLPEKIWAERAGLLRWLIDGYRAWREIGLDPPEAVRVRTERYRSDQDHLGAFLEQRCDTSDPRASTPVKDIREAYETWCEGGQLEPLSKTVWGRNLSERGFEPDPANRHRRIGLKLKREAAP
jgi:putative DNA primase/helicase